MSFNPTKIAVKELGGTEVTTSVLLLTLLRLAPMVLNLYISMSMKQAKLFMVYRAAELLGHKPTLRKAKQIADMYDINQLNRIYLKIYNTGRRVKMTEEDMCATDDCQTK